MVVRPGCSAGHDASAAEGAFLAPGYAGTEKAIPRWPSIACPAAGISEMRVAAVYDNIPGIQQACQVADSVLGRGASGNKDKEISRGP